MVKVSIVILSQQIRPSVIDDIDCQSYKNYEIIIAREKGIVRAMNLALARATGNIFVRIDDDVKLPVHWLEELVGGFRAHCIAGVTGPTFVPQELRRNRISLAVADKPNWFMRWMFEGRPNIAARIYPCGSVSYGSNFSEKIDVDTIDYLEGTNWAMRTNLIRQVGGFDESFDGVCEWFDTDVVYKIKELGYIIVYNPNAYLFHLVNKGASYGERFSGLSRIKNWLRFHKRHSEFHYKKVIWLVMMIGYFLTKGLYEKVFKKSSPRKTNLADRQNLSS